MPPSLKSSDRPPDRPHITVVLAMSLDGKISDRDRSAARFSSPTDLAHLEYLVAESDAVLFGAGTLRAYGTCLSVRDPALRDRRRDRGQPPQPIQIVASASGDLSPDLRFFQQPVPRWLLTTPAGADRWAAISPAAAPCFDRILPQLAADTTDWPSLLQTLSTFGIQRLALLGGGSLIAPFAQADLIDDWQLTLCPLTLGGATAPTPFDGLGFPAAIAPRFHLVSVTAIADEVFLHYRRTSRDGYEGMRV